eukprot:TRINITY_DN1520_c0_g1_i3.p1 TRINITY_DN1520_c0_g1~~TRINITY_DN1520_c0_g1_i3.p1  ORF type:complete len:210 (+),score=68.50 TRINITY_DN1520_c0_g1_i3:218-847(+)
MGDKMDTRGVNVKLTVAANGNASVHVPVKAESVGKCGVQAVIFGSTEEGEFSDALEQEFIVRTPMLQGNSAAYGHFGKNEEGAKAVDLRLPKNVMTNYGGIEVDNSSSLLSGMSGAVSYLHKYPYECSEQLASKVGAYRWAMPLLEKFASDALRSESEVNAWAMDALERISLCQNSNGSFDYYPSDETKQMSFPYLTMRIVEVLSLCSE